ncbi:hypothetical protein AMK59_1007 [Oryctes borbonicus]|uniref:Uncharacterized protein n=1 Tax=Oryctes borbonicus TaxID=1629725 RepID=A0A0T6BBF7_9SCAR|nr:hypothetical protein AMK59_1007 [Oryctes borbonicus]
MEHISQLQLKKYEEILKKIEDEHCKRNDLKRKVQVIDEKIIATGLTLKKKLVKEKIFRVLVKVYHSIHDVYDQLFDKLTQFEIESLLPDVGRKFYFIEVFVSKSFQDRIVQSNWVINVILKNSTCSISKSVNLNRKVTSPICLIIPFGNSIEQTIVDVYLTWPEEETWPFIKIATVLVDISYHFQLHSDVQIRNGISSKVINLSKLHKYKYISSKLPLLKSKLICSSDFQNFLQTLIKNSYHNWDPRKESCFMKTDYTAHAKTTSGFGNAIDVELDVNTNSLILQCNVFEMFYLKKYFLAELSQEMYDIKGEIGRCVKVLLKNIEGNSRNTDVLTHIYRELNDINI